MTVDERMSSSEKAKDYYNSDDADNFYFRIWGGTDIHVGVYASETEAIFPAGRRAVSELASLIPFKLDASKRVLDVGAGFGGASRWLAATFGCHVISFNFSEKQNARNEQLIKEEGLQDRCTVMFGNFERLPFEDGSIDVVWSMDALLHSDQRQQVISECGRVLRKGGCLVFSDLMQVSPQVDRERILPLLARIHLTSFGSPALYEEAARASRLSLLEFRNMPEHMRIHYSRVREELEGASCRLVAERTVHQEFIDAMCKGLVLWSNAARDGLMTWGFMAFQKGE